MKIIFRLLMNTLTGFIIGALTLGVGFAASPNITEEDVVRREMPVWDIIENEAEDVDLDILSEYMDSDILAVASTESTNISDILKSYCQYDENFYDVLCDYFV